MSAADAEKAIRIIAFSGKKVDWPVWSEKFLARARRKGYKDLLLGTTTIPTDKEVKEGLNDKQQVTRDLNEMAYEDLILSISGETEAGHVAFQIVKGAKTDALRSGDSYAAWQRLLKKYASRTAPARLNLRNQLTKCVLKSARDDPDVWLSSLEDLREQLLEAGANVSEEDILEHALNNVPKEYEVTVAKVEHRLGSTDDPLTIEELREQLNLKYERMGFKGAESKSREKDTALFAGGFKGKCRNCGKWGHKSRDCRAKSGKEKADNDEESTAASTFSGFCFYCKKKGHKINECRKKKAADSRKVKKEDETDEKTKSESNNIALFAMPKKECVYCPKRGHNARECTMAIKINERVSSAYLNSDVALTTLTQTSEKTATTSRTITLIADSGASCHMINNDALFSSWRSIREEITVGNGASIQATKIGTVQGEMICADGTSTSVTLYDVKYVRQLAPYNLFSVTTALGRGFNLGNDGRVITLTKGATTLRFDKEVKTQNGWVGGIEFRPLAFQKREGAFSAVDQPSMQFARLHRLLGHPSLESTRQTAKHYGVHLTGRLLPCGDCALAKARQRNLSRVSENRYRPGEKLNFDISSIATESLGGSRYWLLVIDSATNYCWSYFLARKKDTRYYIARLILKLRSKGYPTSICKSDNAGENNAIQELCNEAGIDIKCERTAPNTPQQNGKVERKFATLYGRVRAMLNGAEVPLSIRQVLWAECAATATYYDNIIVPAGMDKSPHKHFWNTDPERPITNLHLFGEVGVIKHSEKIAGKLANKGIPVLFVGYSEEHPLDTYRFLNLDTKRIVLSRDVTWQHLTYNQWIRRHDSEQADMQIPSADNDHAATDDRRVSFLDPETGKSEKNTSSDDDDDDTDDLPVASDLGSGEEEKGEDNLVSGRVENPTDEPPHQTRSKGLPKKVKHTEPANNRVSRELRKLEAFFNPETRPVDSHEESMTNGPTESDEGHNTDEATTTTTPEIADFALLGRECLETKKCVSHKSKPIIANNKNDTNPFILPNGRHILDELDDVKQQNDLSDFDRSERIKNLVGILKEHLPHDFQEAYNHFDAKIRERWRGAIRKEYRDMNTHKVLLKIKRRDMPPNRRCIKCKWVLDIKRDGRFRARLVACGYSQIPGIDFKETYSPVINDITWRILIIEKIIRGYDARIADVETAFLYGILDEEIYMEPPPGFEAESDEVVLLGKALYGLVQAARQYYKKFMKVLRTLGFEGGKADPCLMTRRTKAGIVHIAIWVDDSLLVGDKLAIDEALRDLQDAGFVLKIQGTLDDYLSCEITFDAKEQKGWIHQPHLIKKLERQFEPLVKNLRNYNTPSTPGLTIMRNPSDKISTEMQSTYRSGVGMLLYLVKHTRPDIANAVRELSKVLDGASEAAYKELLRVIKYVLDTKNLCLKIQPKKTDEKWSLTAFSDSDWAADPETRISVYGFVLYYCGVPISWKSKAQKSVTLSTSEAEFVALSETAKEVKFVYQVLMSMGIEVELPIIIRVDNIGAIFMSETVAVSQRTKHIDIRYRFINEQVEDGFLKIIFVRTSENDADLFTKNLGRELHEKHANKLIEEKHMGSK